MLVVRMARRHSAWSVSLSNCNIRVANSNNVFILDRSLPLKRDLNHGSTLYVLYTLFLPRSLCAIIHLSSNSIDPGNKYVPVWSLIHVLRGHIFFMAFASCIQVVLWKKREPRAHVFTCDCHLARSKRRHERDVLYVCVGVRRCKMYATSWDVVTE